jgi:GTP-binding protein YchF
MKIGLIGLPNSGKTTIFNTLTCMDAKTSMYADVKAQPNVAIVNVDDERVSRLSDMYRPKKITRATIEMIDFPGLKSGAAHNGSFGGNGLSMIKYADALALVVRNFHDDLAGPPTPLRDMDDIETELLLSDLVAVETRLERIEKTLNRGQKSGALLAEERVLRTISEHLNENKPIRELAFTEDDEKLIRGFQFLTKKPFLVVLNSDEAIFGRNEELIATIESKYKVIEFAGRFEMELSRLGDDEAVAFMEDMGIRMSARERLTRFAYQTLGYISFFTVGEDEVRAWSIHSGDTAVDAAGAIHSDLARGFIRAECFTYDELIACGTEKRVRENGSFRLEGKDYPVTDGDILSIRFSV